MSLHYNCSSIIGPNSDRKCHKCWQRYLIRFQGVEKLQGFHDYFASQVKVMSSTPIAVVAAAVSSDIKDFSAFAGISDYNFCLVFVCHAGINVRSLVSHLQGIHKSIADEVAQVAKPVASCQYLSHQFQKLSLLSL